MRRAASVACLAAIACACLVRAARGEGLRVGSKAFTESVVLGELVCHLARGAGVPCEHRRALGGTRLCWSALERGDIDVYAEYTGTMLQEIFAAERDAGEAPAPGREAVLARLRTLTAARGLALGAPLGFNNSYALGMRRERAAALGLARVSDLGAHPALGLRFSNEFMDRADGWPALRAAYGLPHADVRGLDHDLAYRGLVAGHIDVTDVYTTDAEIAAYDLAVLADDRGHFPRYDALLVHRRDVETRAPGALAALAPLAGAIDAAAMRSMNAAVEIEGRAEGEVAARFARERLGVAASHQHTSLVGRLLRHGREHLALTAASLLAAIAVAVPLGIAAARRRRLGQLVLAAVGVVQTIPSLALLVFMIPLLGIGAAPAVAALFLYSLLPIVRNTHEGLTSIAPSLRESAEALGLPSRALLWRVELPLASRAILAGVKTAAVINVGTATLGALVGAGGYGQPILTGIRLDDVGLIMEGALPAAALALLVQGAFELADRRLVPRGLRV
jgi:osmoprotectant transport system permease protein